MSCSLCRLPFTPSTHSVCPRWPPPGVLTEKQVAYMKHAVGMADYIFGLVADLVYLGGFDLHACVDYFTVSTLTFFSACLLRR